MKTVALLFALFFFLASVFPCADVCKDIGIINSTHSDKTSDTAQDDCPIFCVCNCCGVVFENVVSSPTISTPFTYTASYGLFCMNKPTSDYNTSIWQPPKQS